MRSLLLILLLLPFTVQARGLGEIYWSPYACSGLVYHFDSAQGAYQIYTRMKVKDRKHGEYYSYQYTEGRLAHRDGAVYVLSGEGLQGTFIIDFSNPEQAILTSSSYGRIALGQCENAEALKLIRTAEEHFKHCDRNVLNCKAP